MWFLSLVIMQIPKKVHEVLKRSGIKELRPAQEKAVEAGLFEDRSLLVCTPTASGKTLIAEMIFLHTIMNNLGKAVYVVPLKALASEKYKDFTQKYGNLIKIAMTTGDKDSAETYLVDYDLIICTAEKLDSLLRHHSPWIRYVKTLIIDEIHLLNDPSRGPTLELIITMLRQIISNMQILGLSATIGNPEELALWMDAQLVEDTWRPVELKKGILADGSVEFYD